ncbi:MAG: MFS transporter [Magnetovibrio sp.]|nr:MFS transporter [Magnetovibrio sp.]
MIDSNYAWTRLTVAVLICTVGSIGFWSVVVVLPIIQAEFGIDRSDAAFPYLATLAGFAAGGIIMGRLADRFGIILPIILGSVMLFLGYITAAHATSLWQFVLAHAIFIGLFGSSATFGPLIADTSLWFNKHRGIAVALVASGNYLSGTLWPPLLQYAIDEIGWRQAHIGIGVICLITILPLSYFLRRRPPLNVNKTQNSIIPNIEVKFTPPSPILLQGLLVVAGLSCCIAMSMPQVHLVAYCGDLGFAAQRGAEMLSIMLGLGIISRLLSGIVADRIGGLSALFLGSTLQGFALLLYLPFDGLVSLYIVSGVFGLSQGGIVPSYALVVRDMFPAREAATRIGLVFTATQIGMATGGWLSGEIYDLTGSYQMAFLNGYAWNLVNLAIVVWLLFNSRRWLTKI